MGFKDELAEFEIYLSSKNEQQEEVISDEYALKALIILNFIDYKKVPDIFLACASMNLLNTYVKKNNSKLSYQYKRHLSNIIKGIEDVKQPKSIMIGYDSSNHMQLLIIQFWSFQFSFQAQRFSLNVKGLLSSKNIVWDGIRKQPCAKEIFEFAYNRSWISNKTMIGRELRDFIDSEILKYKSGKYSFESGKIRKISDIKYATDMTDKFAKNYMRAKLLGCTDRPVIVSGIYKKTWEKHVTFTSIRPYIQGIKALTICDHVNLKRSDVEKKIETSTLLVGKRYYIIGYCEKYPHNNRMGIRLATEYEFVPIFEIGNYESFPKDILDSCHRFGIEENIRNDQMAYTL